MGIGGWFYKDRAPVTLLAAFGQSRNSLRDHNGQTLVYVYFEDEPRAATSGQTADQRSH
jgi:hypothetical protein